MHEMLPKIVGICRPCFTAENVGLFVLMILYYVETVKKEECK